MIYSMKKNVRASDTKFISPIIEYLSFVFKIILYELRSLPHTAKYGIIDCWPTELALDFMGSRLQK